jgi:tetratricopeptide (TPR) repeat protein
MLERFNREDASNLFEEALKIDKKNAGAALGLALVASDRFDRAAVDYAKQALEFDPELVEAQELLASLMLEDSDPKQAREAAEKAISLAPDAFDAMAVEATIDWLKSDLLTGDIKSPWMDKILLASPLYGKGYSIAAHFFILNRRYVEGIRLYHLAIETDPKLWEARSELGINEMRLGKNDEARTQLTMCYENGYRNPETTNSLRLLDSFKNFDTVQTPRAVLFFNKKETALLEPYFADVVERAMTTYEAKYHFKLPVPVRVEVYPEHEDFAVRTSGMPGIGGLLGVTFGTAVAMDSPSARPPAQFHWASALWHEMSHVYVLTATHHLVPRWFTEGLAVYEETLAAPGWGDRLQPDEIKAFKDHKLLPVLDLDRGFIRPEYPAQVIVSYFEAGQMCAFIAGKWGFPKLVDMIYAFGARKTTAQAVEETLGVKPEDFDKQFMAWLEPRIAPVARHLDDWKKGTRSASQALEAKHYDDAIKEGLAVRDYFPDYVEGGSVYEILSAAYEAKGDKQAAIDQLETYARIGGRSPATLKKLGALEAEAGHADKAAAALDRVNYIYPEDEDLHQRLGKLYLDQKNAAGAIREFRAALALKPIDQAESHYELARALELGRRLDDARGEVLLALESAPDFKPAQKLLLELTGKNPE